MFRPLVTILLSFYFVLSSGLAMNLHYCMNKLDSMQLGSSSSDTCGRCGMDNEETGGCCHNEVVFVKIQSEQQHNIVDFSFSPLGTKLVSPPITHDNISRENISSRFVTAHSPPGKGQDTYLVNRVFRI